MPRTVAQLEAAWKETNQALEDLRNLRVEPVAFDVRERESELLRRLDEIEFEMGEALR